VNFPVRFQVKNMQVKIDESWQKVLKDEFEKPYFKELIAFVKEEYANHQVYPPGKQIFHAFEECPFGKVKVVILGQDPYHGDGQANGLAFSVNNGIRTPPSLKNIFKEIKNDLGKEIPDNGNLERWAEQGVLLLNATLTVRATTPGSHQKKGWETFTDAVIQTISDEKEHIVFMLWGAYAQKKGAIIDEKKHLVLKAAHPSPFAADKGFFGTHHFSKANAYLKAQGNKEIDW
jgi:uracil-DNA glycosylase